MGLNRWDEFRQYPVPIVLINGLTRRQEADDLGVVISTLNKWITAHRDTGAVSKEDLKFAKQSDRLRLEIRILKVDGEIPKKIFRAAASTCAV